MSKATFETVVGYVVGVLGVTASFLLIRWFVGVCQKFYRNIQYEKADRKKDERMAESIAEWERKPAWKVWREAEVRARENNRICYTGDTTESQIRVRYYQWLRGSKTK